MFILGLSKLVFKSGILFVFAYTWISYNIFYLEQLFLFQNTRKFWKKLGKLSYKILQILDLTDFLPAVVFNMFICAPDFLWTGI